jgi:hypothetical protein
VTPSSQFAALVPGILWEHLPLGNRAIKRYLERTFEEECLDYKERVRDGAGCAQPVKFTPKGALVQAGVRLSSRCFGQEQDSRRGPF